MAGIGRIKRARQACVQCRTKKTRCHTGDPPGTCLNCLEDGARCEWPEADGRSLRHKRKGSASPKPVPATSRDGMAQHWPHPVDLVGSGSAETRRDRAADSSLVRGSEQLQPILPTSTPGQVSTDLMETGQPTISLSSVVTNYEQPVLWPALVDTQTTNIAFPPFPPTTSWSDETDFNSFLMSLGGPSDFDHTLSPLDSPPSRHPVQAEMSSMRGQYANRMIRRVWLRPHGFTAIAPGLQRIALKVHVDSGTRNWYGRPGPHFKNGAVSFYETLFDEHGLPTTEIMLSMLEIFIKYFGCQFPGLDRGRLESQIRNRTGSVLLMNCIAATASRFSDHPLLTMLGQERHEYGNPFLDIARQLVGSVLSVPSRDTVMAMVLFAGLGHGIDSESEEWMMAGMAVRMALDLGLHMDAVPGLNMSAEEQRLNRLTFWSACMLDFALSFGTGRETTLRVESITQSFPSSIDIPGSFGGLSSPFPFAAHQMFMYGDLINALNGPHDEEGMWLIRAKKAMQEAVSSYHALPSYIRWNSTNFKQQSEAQQGSIFVQLHLWMHTVLASAYLTDTDILDSSDLLKDELVPPEVGLRWAASSRSARSIIDILTIVDMVDPYSCHALPFANQAFFVAGSCLIKEIESGVALSVEFQGQTPSSTVIEDDEHLRLMVSSIASNIAAVQRALTTQATFWVGVAWVRDALQERIQGAATSGIDLHKITSRLPSFISVPDAGVVVDDETREESYMDLAIAM